MSQFRTEIFVKNSSFLIDYHTKTCFIGSCFSNNIGNVLKELKFPVVLNPFGVLYNPVSVKNALNSILIQKKYTEKDLNFSNDKWFSYQHHGSFSSSKKDEILNNINQKSEQAHFFLRNTNILFITFGTAWYYRLNRNGEIVANCHKQAAQLFTREMLSVNEIVDLWNPLIKQLQEFNRNIKIVFTLSPVRHWKDGAENNQLSKSVLNVAIHKIIKNNHHCSYFPAYEIMMDDLRDYRFYEDDFLHPNKLAINYIWNKFCTVFIPDKTLQISKKIEKINKALNHKILHPKTPEHKRFLKTQLDKINNLLNEHPGLDFTDEIKYLKKEIAKIN